jgi:microcystin degradation protein MlrC
MKVAIAKIFQETDTFNPKPFTLDDFKRFGVYFGEDIVDQFSGVGELGGFIQAAEADSDDIELIPILGATSWAGGRWTSEAMEFLKGSLLAGLEQAMPLDGMLISLHGAMASENVDDASGYLLTAIRTLIGGEIPLVCTLDHHSNLTNRMVETTDALVAYRECPHTDSVETGLRGAKLLFSILRGAIRPTVSWQKVPLLTPIDKFFTAEQPLKSWFDLADEYETRQDVLSTSLFPVQPWLDVPELGWAAYVITDGEPKLAQDLAVNLANHAWYLRHEFIATKSTSPKEAIHKAVTSKGGPIILADGGDNMNSGAPGDSTCLLRELLKHDIDGTVLMPVVDPEAVSQLLAIGMHTEVTISLGGKFDNIFNRPVEITGQMTTISDGKIISTGHLPVEFNMGRTVLFEVGSIKIVISEYPGPSHEPAVYTHIGLDPKEAKIVVVKTPVGFRISYSDIMKDFIVVDCPGLSTPHIEKLDFSKIPRPMFPLDDLQNWSVES